MTTNQTRSTRSTSGPRGPRGARLRRPALTTLAAGAALATTVTLATPAQAADRTVTLRNPSGGVHAVLNWDDSVDTLCLTLKARGSSAYADADMSLLTGTHAHSLSVRPGSPRKCTGNLSIPEDRLARMRVYGGSNTFHFTSGWVQFYT